ncbi:MAG: SRPBCC family protein [Actinomycetota bacterium]
MNETDIIIEPGRQDIVITRLFDAPRDVVFNAITDPALIPAWWGPRSATVEVDVMEAKPGGRWRFVHRDDTGAGHGFHGVYHDVVAPERIVQTFEFEGAPGHVVLETLTLEDVDGRTRYTAQAVHQSVESRDAAVRSGMETGARETVERLAELVAKL